MEYEPVLTAAIEKFGVKNQMIKAIEELGELQTALAKNLNSEGSYRLNVIDEIADCAIMLQQLTLIYGQDFVAQAIDRKIERLATLVTAASIT